MKFIPTYRYISKGLNGVLVALFLSLTLPSSGQIAIIVNATNPISEISVNELRAIFLGKQVYFNQSNDLIKLCEFKEDLNHFCEKLYGFSGKSMNRHWFQLIFSGTSANVPKKMNSPEQLINFIKENNTAIGYIDLKKIPLEWAGVKIILLDGKLPKSKGYILSFHNSPSSSNSLANSTNNK